MNISLAPELEETINAKVASGNYLSANDVVREGLRLLSEQDAVNEVRREELRRVVQSGFDSVNRGDFAEYNRDSVVRIADEIKAEGRRRAAGQAA